MKPAQPFGATSHGWYAAGRRSALVFALLLWAFGLAVASPARAENTTSAATELSLSSTERQWLAAHPVVRLGIDSGYAPYSFLDEQGRLQGVVAEFLPHIERLLGIRFQIVDNLPWLELMNAVRGKNLDAVATVVHLPERDAFLTFSTIYLPTPLVVMTRNDAPQLRSLKDLASLSLVLVEGYSSSKQLTALYPELHPNYVSAPLAGLQALALGEADAYVGALGVSSYLAGRHGYANLKVNAGFDMETNGQRFGVRKDWPELAQLLDKALAAIPSLEREAIFAKWLPLQFGEIQRLSKTSATTRLFPWLLALVGFVIVGYLTQLLWNRQLKRELTRRRAELERSQAIAHLGDWSLDLVSKRMQWSSELFRIAARPPQTLDWATLSNWTHPDDRAALEDYFMQLGKLSQGEQLAPNETRLLQPGGDIRWLEINFSSNFEEHGSSRVFNGTALDITERKHIEEALRASETQYRKLFEQMTSGFVLFEVVQNEAGLPIDLVILAVNKGFETATGLQAANVIGKRLSYVLPGVEQDSVNWIDIYGQIALGGEPRLLEQHSALLAHHYSVAAYQAGPGQCAVTFTDVTERKYAEAALQASETRFTAMFEQAAVGIAQVALDGSWLQVNHRLCEIVGYSCEEMLSMTFQDITYPDDLKADQEFVRRMLVGEMVNYSLQKRYLRKNGGTVWIHLTVSLTWKDDGKPDYFIAVVEDITGNKRMGAELDRYRNHLEQLVEERTAQLVEARTQAEAANVAKSAFLANMSHEIRTPMNAVIGLTHLMKRAGANPEQLERLGKIESAGQHLLSIINDILDISKIEAGRMQLEDSNFHLSVIIDSIASLIGDAARAKGLAIDIDLDAVPAWLRGDPTRLRQALLNFAGNAVKFTEHGKIILRTRLLESRNDKLLVRFEVEDTGIGIAADNIPRLFQAFEQADTSTTRKFGGTGLGLTITRHLAQMMGGEVGIDSIPGQGSTFWFTAKLGLGRGVMPAADDRAEHLDAESQLRLHPGGVRLLLAEDNLINREVAQELLHSVGLEVDTAVNGREALEKAGRQSYDLILMDIQMPEMGGLEATQAIRALPGWERIPILAMTANAFDEDRLACKAVGMNDFVAKPVDPAQFFSTLLRWLSPPAADASAGPTSAVPPAPIFAGTDTTDALPVIAGVDTALGLRMLNGNRSTYLRLLRRFAIDQCDDMTKLRELLAQDALEDARRLAHTLKGAAASLGVTQVVAGAAELEAVLKTRDADMTTIEPLAVAVETVLRSLASEILAAIPA